MVSLCCDNFHNKRASYFKTYPHLRNKGQYFDIDALLFLDETHAPPIQSSWAIPWHIVTSQVVSVTRHNSYIRLERKFRYTVRRSRQLSKRSKDGLWKSKSKKQACLPQNALEDVSKPVKFLFTRSLTPASHRHGQSQWPAGPVGVGDCAKRGQSLQWWRR